MNLNRISGRGITIGISQLSLCHGRHTCSGTGSGLAGSDVPMCHERVRVRCAGMVRMTRGSCVDKVRHMLRLWKWVSRVRCAAMSQACAGQMCGHGAHDVWVLCGQGMAHAPALEVG